jgi:hypothetical protein
VSMCLCAVGNSRRDAAVYLYSATTAGHVLFVVPVRIVQVSKLVQFSEQKSYENVQ